MAGEGSQTWSPLQTRIDPGVLQAGTQRSLSQTVLGGRHARSCVHSAPRSMNAPSWQDQPSVQSLSEVQLSEVDELEASMH